MPQPATINDPPVGEIVKHGSQIVGFSLAGNLIAEDIQWSKGFASVDFPDHSGASQPGVIKSAAYSATKAIGSMTVQVKTASTIIFPGEFVTFFHQGFGNIKFLVTNVGVAYTQNGATKIPIQMAEWFVDSTLPQINTYDGDFSAKACGPIRYSRPIPQSDALLYRQKFRQLRSTWTRLNMNTPGPLGGSFLVEETELEDAGVADVVTWDRVYSTIPSSWSMPVNVTKNYQAAQYIFILPTGPVTSQNMVGWSQSIKATMTHNYYINAASVPNIQGLPILLLIPYPGGPVLTDVGTGFPTQFYPFGNGFSNNFGVSFISATIEPWLGAMMVVKTIQG